MILSKLAKLKISLYKISIVFLISLILVSCGRKKRTIELIERETAETELIPIDTNGAVKGDWVIQQEMSDAEKLNPIVSNDATASEIANYIYDTLLEDDRVTYELIPGVASELPVVSDDLLTYTFNLRKDVKFSDGKPLTGKDVIFTVKVIKNPFTDAQALRNYFSDVADVSLVNGDPYIVQFKMSKPYFRALYSLGGFEILPKHILDPENLTDKFDFAKLNLAEETFANAQEDFGDLRKHADFMNSQEVARDPKYVIGSGPYKLEEWITGQRVVLSRNENYWNKKSEPAYPDKLVFKTIQDQTSAITAAKNGEIDIMNVVRNIDFVENLKNPEQFNLEKAIVARPVYLYIAWNAKRPFFADRKVRMALSHCVDRETIINRILYGLAVPIQSHIYYKSELLNTDLEYIPYDLDKAKQLLNEAGWSDTDGDGVIDKIIDGKKVDFSFTFMNNQNPERGSVLLVLVNTLKYVGIKANIQDFEWSVFLDKQDRHEYDACIGGWVLSASPPDPFQIFHSSQSRDGGSNYISYDNPESDRLIEEYRITADENKRRELLMRWQRVIYDDQPYTFLWSPAGKYVYQKRFRNARWYAYPYPNKSNEWWVPTADQKYKN
ncbi:MAG: ABC transporter substrate-binding protein [Ignavibacteriaceae bacterium]|nr:Oligopeptide-binding protein AppA [Ignavibacteria bacterium]MEB2329574.1 ABC transporter substrate-binding protein [Ignavibacteriaceae bacterium]